MISDLKTAVDIDRAVSLLLRQADVDDCLPTPVEQLVEGAGLLAAQDYVLSEAKIQQAPRALRRLLREAKRKILGVLDRRERVIHVSDAIDDANKRRFVTCHEVSHHILPWQRDLLVLGDTDKTLSPTIDLAFEREANQGAAELLFQRDLLARIARDYPVDLTSVGALAAMFGSSFRATFRRWIETHGDATIAGLVLDPMPVGRQPLTFRRYELNESQLWRDKFGTRRFHRRISQLELPFLADLTTSWASDVDATFTFATRDGASSTLRAQSKTTSHNILVLLWLPARERFVARHRANTRLVIAKPGSAPISRAAIPQILTQGTLSQHDPLHRKP